MDENQKAFEEAVRNANLPEFDFDKVNQQLKEKAQANTHHTPRQQGPHIICVSCPYQHTLMYIGSTKSLIGINSDGSYQLKDRF